MVYKNKYPIQLSAWLFSLCVNVFVIWGDTALAGGLQVEVFEGEFPTVNSFIFSDGRTLVVMDVQRTSEAAKALAEIVKAKDLPLTQIFITHGHTDHFMGLDVFHKTFPDAEIVVHTKEIKQDIKNYATWMNDGGWLDDEPALKPKSNANPNGFDYDANIRVLPGNTLTLEGGGNLELTSDYKPNEGEHITTVYSKDLNALFLSDLGYNKVHLWMGAGVTKQHIANWREELAGLEKQYAKIKPAIYPGHGIVTDMTLFGSMIRYIDDFNRVISKAKSKEEAKNKMIGLYPDYEQAEFLLLWSVDNHMK